MNKPTSFHATPNRHSRYSSWHAPSEAQCCTAAGPCNAPGQSARSHLGLRTPSRVVSEPMSTQPPPHTYRSAPTLPVSIGIDFLIFDSNELIWGQCDSHLHTDHKTIIKTYIYLLILKLFRKNRGSFDDMLQLSYTGGRLLAKSRPTTHDQ